MTDEMLGELMAVVGMANETNRLANGYQVEIDEDVPDGRPRRPGRAFTPGVFSGCASFDDSAPARSAIALSAGFTLPHPDVALLRVTARSDLDRRPLRRGRS